MRLQQTRNQGPTMFATNIQTRTQCCGEVRWYTYVSCTHTSIYGTYRRTLLYVGATCHSDKNDMRW